MRLLHVLARTGIFLVLLLEIAAGFYLTLGEETAWRQAVTRLVLYRWEALAASLALACLLLIDLLTLAPRQGENARFVTFRSKDGQVSISVRAIREFLQRVASEFAAVKDMHCSIRSRRNSLSISVDLRVTADEYVPELCQTLQERIRESLREQLGIPRIGGVVVRIREILPPSAVPQEETEEIGV